MGVSPCWPLSVLCLCVCCLCVTMFDKCRSIISLSGASSMSQSPLSQRNKTTKRAVQLVVGDNGEEGKGRGDKEKKRRGVGIIEGLHKIRGRGRNPLLTMLDLFIYVNILLFHWEYFTSFFDHYIEQNIYFYSFRSSYSEIFCKIAILNQC